MSCFDSLEGELMLLRLQTGQACILDRGLCSFVPDTVMHPFHEPRQRGHQQRQIWNRSCHPIHRRKELIQISSSLRCFHVLECLQSLQIVLHTVFGYEPSKKRCEEALRLQLGGL
jgi:hypothetical protein